MPDARKVEAAIQVIESGVDAIRLEMRLEPPPPPPPVDPPVDPPPRDQPITERTRIAIGTAARREGFMPKKYMGWVHVQFPRVRKMTELTEAEGQLALRMALSDQFIHDGPIDPPPPASWQPPLLSLGPVPFLPDDGTIKSTWAGDRVTLGADGNQDVRFEGALISKVSGVAPWGTAVFDGCTIQNEYASQFSVGVNDKQPPVGAIENDGTWETQPGLATPDMGTVRFQDCTFIGAPDSPHYHGFGGKMHLHPESVYRISMRNCTTGDILEHGYYGEWAQIVEIIGCVFGADGGAAIQIASRAGHGPVGNYQHGNPFNRPTGLGGWIRIADVVVNDDYFNFRDASLMQVVGSCGPVVIERVVGYNCIGLLAVWSDVFKGAWVFPDGEPDKPRRWRRDVEGQNPPTGVECYRNASDTYWLPKDHYTTPALWCGDASMTYSQDGAGRGALEISGVQDIHLGVLDIPPSPFPAVIFDAWYGGQVRNKRKPGTNLPNVSFYDRASVMALAGRIGEDIPHPTDHGKGKFRAFSMEELEQLIVP